MKPVVSLEVAPTEKRRVQEAITQLLPEWFGRPESNRHYAEQAARLSGYVARVGGEAKGLLLLKNMSRVSAEVYWLGVVPTLHRSGIGRALLEAAATTAQREGKEYLFVATLHQSADYEPYERTRRFYEATGFHFVLEEQFPDPENPSAFYMKVLR